MFKLDELESLKGCFLIASPMMKDESFKKTVVFLSEVKLRNSFGFIISLENKTRKFNKLLKGSIFEDSKIFHGGPTDEKKLFILHTTDYLWPTTLKITNDLAITNFKDALKKQEKLPNKYRIVSGYANWYLGQLEQEISLGYWLIHENDSSLLFDNFDKEKWVGCMQDLKINEITYSNSIGNA